MATSATPSTVCRSSVELGLFALEPRKPEQSFAQVTIGRYELRILAQHSIAHHEGMGLERAIGDRASGYPPEVMRQVILLRKMLSAVGQIEGTELLLQRLGKTKTNKEFLAAIAKSMEEK